MATELEQDTELAVELEPIDLLKLKLKKTQTMLLVTLGMAVLAVSLALTQLLIAQMNKGQLSDTEISLLEQSAEHAQQLLTLQSQLPPLVSAVSQSSTRINTLVQQVSAIDINDPDNAILRIQRILIRQERDYRDFLTSLEVGMNDLQMMIPHSSGWWESFQERFEESISLSQARENYLINLREN
ncbi:MAG: hypothetical protein RQ757_10245 [Pseudomonadales bacterium]|nr:hypothetical protein [Pseudomonadales bacterium]